MRSWSHWPAKFVDERVGLRVGEHPGRLGLEDGRIAEPALAGEPEELVVGHARPEEIAEPRGQLPVGQGADALRGLRVGRAAVLDPEEEVRRDQDALERDLHRLLDRPAVAADHPVEVKEAVDLLLLGRPAEGPAGEPMEVRADRHLLGTAQRVLGEDPGVRGGHVLGVVRLDRAEDRDLVDDQVTVAPLALVGVVGLVVVVQEGDRDPSRARLDVDAGLVGAGIGVHGEDVGDLDGLAVDLEGEPGRVGSGLLAECLDADPVLAGAGGSRGRSRSRRCWRGCGRCSRDGRRRRRRRGARPGPRGSGPRGRGSRSPGG